MRNKQSFIKGAVILGLAGIVARSLGLFFRWPVTMLIGDEGIGLYQLAYPIFMFIIGILSGFPIAISRMVSERMAVGRRYDAYRVFKSSLFLLSIIGIVLSILLFICSPYLIRILKWRSDAYYSMAAIAFAPIFVSIMDSYRGYFQGLQMMTMPAVSQIVEQFGRVAVGVGLTYLLIPKGVGISAGGASFGACAGGLLGSILLFGGYMKYRAYLVPLKPQGKVEGIRKIMKELAKTAIPISVGMTVGSIMSLIDSIIVPARLLSAGFSDKAAIELYGQLTGKAHVLINVPLTLSVALGTSLVPAISEVKALRNIGRIKDRAESAVRVSMLIALPSMAGLFILADPILKLIFPGVSEGAEVLRILSFSVVFIVLAQTLVSILQGVGDVISPVKNLAIGSVCKLAFAYILTGIPMLNVKGAAISSIIGYAAAAILNFRDAMKCTYFNFDIDKMFLRPLLCVMLMGFTAYFLYNETLKLWGVNSISTIISIITGIIVYVMALLITRCISVKELLKYSKNRRKRK